jgi:hypothetical protein
VHAVPQLDRGLVEHRAGIVSLPGTLAQHVGRVLDEPAD